MVGHRSELPRGLKGLSRPVGAVCFDWGGTLMVDDGPDGVPMFLWPKVSLVAGAKESLHRLHGLLPLCVATNAGQSDRAMIERALERGDLLQFLDRIYCRNDVGFAKDRPEFWSAVGDDLGLPLAEIVMIGDGLESDVRAPRRFGVQAVWFNDRDLHPEPAVELPTTHSLEVFAERVSCLVGAPSQP